MRASIRLAMVMAKKFIEAIAIALLGDIVPKFPGVYHPAVEAFHFLETNMIIPSHILLPCLLLPMPAPVRYRNYAVFAARSS